jgi:hypothetical protein
MTSRNSSTQRQAMPLGAQLLESRDPPLDPDELGPLQQ